MSKQNLEENLFPKIKEEVSKDDEYCGPTVIESLCVNCEENGETRLLFVTIPHFREVIVSSFSCENCGYRNQEVQFGGAYGEKGIEIKLCVKKVKDLNRQVVKSDYARLRIPELELEIPSKTQKGKLTTIEGILLGVKEDLEKMQPLRKIQEPEQYKKIELFIQKIESLIKMENPFNVEIYDPSGNSTIENYFAPKDDPQMKINHFKRTVEHDKMLGLGLQDEEKKEGMKIPKKEGLLTQKEADSIISKFGVSNEKEISTITDFCFGCGKAGECKILETDIPHFKKIVIMAFNCDHCGFKTNEVKTSGEISKKGKKISVKVESDDDLNRDVLKSDSCSISIPEVDLLVTQGTLGGRFTTIEGVLLAVIEHFENTAQFQLGDSVDNEKSKKRMLEFIEKLKEMREGKKEFTFVVDDPLSNTFVQNIYAPDPDPNMKIEEYTRSKEQDDELGLLDMKTENYEN